MMLLIAYLFMTTFSAQGAGLSPAAERDALLELSGVQGGLVVHLGCARGQLTQALCAGPAFRVHGLDTDAGAIRASPFCWHPSGI